MSGTTISSIASEAQLEISSIALLAANFVNSTNEHIFLTGKAGTGKTTFLRQLASSTYKKHLIVAPTGIAALNANGVTIHSQFLLPFGSMIPERYLPNGISQGDFHDQNTLASRRALDSRRRKLLRQCDLLIIDEVSMLRADILDAIDYRMRSAKGRYNESFGGAQVLLIGDLFQLAPIVKDHEWSVLSNYYKSIHFFEALCLKRSGFVQLELDKVYRQQDEIFLGILNNLRNDQLSQGDIDILNSHYQANVKSNEEIITLTTHNYRAQEINTSELHKLNAPLKHFDAEVEDDFPESMYPVPERLEIKEGAQVMFIRNDNLEKRYYNGKLATVLSVDRDGILVQLADSDDTIVLRKEEWENKKYEVNEQTNDIEEKVIGRFSHYPVKLAWAITVHKSQGLTFDKAIIDVGKAFAPGQVYVALSRLRSLDGLVLRTRIDPSAVSNDAQVVEFSERRKGSTELSEILLEGQKDFLKKCLQQAFDLEEIRKQLVFIQEKYNSKQEFADAIMREALPELTAQFVEEAKNTRTFREQLARLLEVDDQQALLGRIGKGSAYYSEFLIERFRAVFQHRQEVDQFTRVSKYLGALEELEGMMIKQVEQIQHASTLVSSILSAQPYKRDLAIDKQRIDRLQGLREEVTQYVADHRQMNGTRSGRKRKAKDTRKKQVKGETYSITYAMFNEGKTIEEIATARGLKASTLEGHLARGIGEGEIEINKAMAEETLVFLIKTFKDSPSDSITTLHRELRGQYSFGLLRMVQAHLARLKTKTEDD